MSTQKEPSVQHYIYLQLIASLKSHLFTICEIHTYISVT